MVLMIYDSLFNETLFLYAILNQEYAIFHNTSALYILYYLKSWNPFVLALL